MSDVLLVDWLGRAGIAQCTEAWAIELAAAGHQVRVVTRPGRELGAGIVAVEGPSRQWSGLLAHGDLVRHVLADLKRRPPDVVVLQNFLLPALESQVVAAAHRAGAKVIYVAHDHLAHGRFAGVHAGMARLLRGCDVVVAHSAFVADALPGVTAELLPHPLQLGMLRLPPPATSPLDPGAGHPADHLAVHFGVLNRRVNKGTAVVEDLARGGVPGWRFAFLGLDAPIVPGAVSVDRFLAPNELVAALRHCSVALLPYRFASQSGAIMLAQALGVVPVATRVGGLPEQIADGETGLLVARDATVDTWCQLLAGLDGERVAAMGRQARAAAEAAHAGFVAGITKLVEP